MARSLAEVLHYFIPEAEDVEPARRAARALPLCAVPLGERDVVRAAHVWNLGVEIARLGGQVVLVAPETGDGALWPAPGRGPVGMELVLTRADGPAALLAAARRLAEKRSVETAEGGLLLVRLPPGWIDRAPERAARFERALLLVTAEARDLAAASALAGRLLRVTPDVALGATIHGVRRVAEAAHAFERLALDVERRHGRGLRSYGLLMDDLHLYRSIVSRRPVGISHPHSPAARTLREVAELLLEDAREPALG